ncbi:MAG TPA: hypothetical protein VFB50_12360 [Chloroflexota bacterium]|nr:hypothetical protein [Chloroflexota bacterium]
MTGRDLDDPIHDLNLWNRKLHRDIDKLKLKILPRLGELPRNDPLVFRRFLVEALADLDVELGKLRSDIDRRWPS